MSQKTACIATLLFLTICSAVFLICWALPGSKTINFPKITSGFVETGPVWHRRALETQDIQKINHWLQEHNFAWSHVKGIVPSAGNARLILQTDQGKEITLIAWTGLSAADWNNTIAVNFPKPEGKNQNTSKIAYKGFYGEYMQTFSTKAFAPIRMIIDGFPFRRTWYP